MSEATGEEVTASEREAGLGWRPSDGGSHVGCPYLAAAVEHGGRYAWVCNKCGWGAPREDTDG